MNYKLEFIITLMAMLLAVEVKADCDTDQQVKAIIEKGSVVELKDGSVWQIEPVDTDNTMYWRPGAHVTVCEGELINPSAKQLAHAARIPGEGEGENPGDRPNTLESNRPNAQELPEPAIRY